MTREQIDAEWSKWNQTANMRDAMFFIAFAEHIAKLERKKYIDALDGLIGQIEQGHLCHGMDKSPSLQLALDKAIRARGE